MTEQTPTVEDVAQRLDEMEALAIRTGAKVQIDPPEFSADGTTWSAFWLNREEQPAIARATVYRDGVPTQVYVSWEESLPAVEDWRELWLRRPMKLFGAYALRAALRRAFRDVIGERREPDEQTDGPDAEPRAREWATEFIAATTVEQLDALRAEARKARAFTPDADGLGLKEVFDQARLRLVQQDWHPSSAEQAEQAPDLMANLRADLEQKLGGKSAARQPQDHKPPQNRAARRKSKRGRRS